MAHIARILTNNVRLTLSGAESTAARQTCSETDAG